MIDAMGCQKEIAKTIVDQQADYLLEVKENQGHRMKTLRSYFPALRKSLFGMSLTAM